MSEVRFYSMQIVMGDNLGKIRENIHIFPDFPWVCHTLKAKYVNKYGLMQVFYEVWLFTRENTARNSQKVYTSLSLLLYEDAKYSLYQTLSQGGWLIEWLSESSGPCINLLVYSSIEVNTCF